MKSTKILYFLTASSLFLGNVYADINASPASSKDECELKTEPEKPAACASPKEETATACPAPQKTEEKKECTEPAAYQIEDDREVLENCSALCSYALSLRHTEGHWLDNREGYTTIGVFAPFQCTNNGLFSFVDLRSHIFNNGRTAGNFGGGIRYLNFETSSVFGLNAFYDYRQGGWNHYYNQFGAGLEVLSCILDLRVNGYIPIGQQTGHSRRSVFFLGDDFVASCRTRRSAHQGMDAEIGKWLVNEYCGYFDLYGAIGFYAYFPRHRDNNLYGFQSRIAGTFGDYISVDARLGYDKENKMMIQAGLTIAIPFESLFSIKCSSCNSLCQPVYRQDIMFIGDKECCWKWNWDDRSPVEG